MDHPAEIVHRRQDDGGHHPHLLLKRPLLPSGIWKTGPEVNLRSIWILPTDGHRSGLDKDLPEGCDIP